MFVAAAPATAEAHGPVNPVASSYLATVDRVPAGVTAKVVDGDQQMWLVVPAQANVTVLDYRGAPYLRFTRSGVAVNRNSLMYYLNMTPIAEAPPANLTRTTPPDWQRVTTGHRYGWHDGRLAALAVIALAPGATYVGRWNIPLLVDGHLVPLSGGLFHAGAPSIVWFWTIVVLLLCVLAAWRIHRPRLDARLSRALGVGALVGIVAVAFGRELHGRPTVSVFQLIELGLILAFVAWGLRRVALQRPGYFSYFVIAFVALWEGAELIPTLLHGFVLLAVPAFVARVATVLCLGCGAAMILFVFRLFDQSDAGEAVRSASVEEHSTEGLQRSIA